MSIFLFVILGFIAFYYPMDFWGKFFQPEITILLPFFGAALGAVLGYYFHKKSDSKLSFLLKSINNIVALLFIILGGTGSLFFGSFVFKALFLSSYCETSGIFPCGGLETMFFVPSVIILIAGIFGFIASRKKSI